MAIEMAGATDRIDYSNVYNVVTAPFTYSSFVGLDDTPSRQYLLCWHISGDGGIGPLIWWIDTSAQARIQVTVDTDGTSLERFASDNSFPHDGTRRHVCVTWDGNIGVSATNIQIYIDNVQKDDAGTDGTGTVTAATGSWSIGGRIFDDARNFDGRNGETAVWDRVLNSTERTMLFNGFSPLFIPNGLRFYPKLINKNSSNCVISGKTAIFDGCSNSAHGAIIYPAPPYIITAPTVGAITNQFQRSNLGVDLYDGALL